MKLYINIEYKKEGAKINSNENIFLNINSIDDLKKSVIDYCIKYYTWRTIFSFNVVARLDGSCNTIDKVFYQKQPLNIICKQERYNFSKGAIKGSLIWSKDAIIHEN